MFCICRWMCDVELGIDDYGIGCNQELGSPHCEIGGIREDLTT